MKPARGLAILCCAGILIVTAGCTKSSKREPLAPLVEALGSRRPLEARLTGGFPYAPCLACARCEDRPEKLEPHSIALAIGRMASKSLRLQAEAIANLAAGTKDGVTRAVQKLETAQSGADARVLSDLAAAYVERACRDDAPYDLVRALTTVERAVAADPRLREALFNRALILERLHLKGQAMAAWARYQAVDPGTGWSREAARHVDDLSRSLKTNSEEAGRARELAMNELLAQWGESVLADQRSAAASSLRAAREIGEALRSRGGDRMVADAVARIDRLSASAPGAAGRLARGHAAYGAATRLFRELSIEAAGVRFREAREEFSFGGSPMLLWAECGLAGVELSRHRYESAFETFAALASRIDRRRYPALHGRLSWGMGLVRGRQGRLMEALERYREAEASFGEAHEGYNELTMQSMSAESLKLLGQDEPAWTHRYQALAALAELPAGRQLHNLLWEAADDLLYSGEAAAAKAFQEEDVEVARASRDPFMIAEAFHRRGRILAALGRREEALRDIAEARTVNSRGASEVTRATTTADIDRAEGEIRLARDPRVALALLTRAVEAFHEAGRPAEEILSRLTRARASMGLGLEADAEHDLGRALALFETEREAIGAPSFRQSFSEAAQSLFDEMILVQAERHRDPRRALVMAERARTVPGEYGDRAVGGAATLELDLSRIPADVALVEYALSGNRLLVWTIRRGGIEFSDRRIAPQAFAAQVSELIAAVRGGSEEAIAETSAKLYDHLIPPGVGDLPESVQLVFIPDRILNGIPFAALKNPRTGRYLVEDHASSVAPSAALYLASSRPSRSLDRARWSALMVSNPKFDRRFFPFVDLPGAAAEAAAVGNLYDESLILAGREATRTRVLAEIDRHEVFGFSGHAVFNPQAPEDSYLVAASEPSGRGTIPAREISALRLHRLRLVVLSACHTSAGTSRRIGGLSGLARPFLEAGASAVLATLWDVDDVKAEELALEFHRRFRETGDAARAIRFAQLSACRGNRFSTRSPGHWAGFQVVGELSSRRQLGRGYGF